MDLAEKLEVMAREATKESNPEKASKLMAELLKGILKDIQRDGKEVTSLEIHERIEPFYQAAVHNSKKHVA